MSIRVLVVDDSAVARIALRRALSAAPDIEVIATAPDPYVARDMIVDLKPDVVTLDIMMPRMDGLTFLRKLMRYHPLPVVILSAYTTRGEALALEAMAEGAVDVVAKPESPEALSELAQELVEKIRAAAAARLPFRIAGPAAPQTRAVRWKPDAQKMVLSFGASTGGPQALERILVQLPEDAPGALIVQHMPEHFTAAFAERLNRLCAIRVREARSGDRVEPGVALIAPGNYHMVLRGREGRFRVDLNQAPRVHRHRPSVDVLFKSVAEAAGSAAVGVLLTGMGEDGAEGLLEMRRRGAHTIAQDEATSVVHGMPGAAIALGAACEVLPLDRIAESIVARVNAP